MCPPSIAAYGPIVPFILSDPMTKPNPKPGKDPMHHTMLEDIQGLGTGILMCSFGLIMLTHLGLITGQTAGVAVILSYLTGWSFGTWFFLINIPFYWVAWRRMGKVFTLKTLGCVVALSVATDLMPAGVQFQTLDPWLGAILLGVMTGTGILVIIRHGGSLGGMGVVALLIQDSTGFRAGYVQQLFDLALFAIAAFLFPLSVVFYSLLGAAVLNTVISFNHRRDRYIAT